MQDVEEFPDLAAAFDRKHKQTTENIPCVTPIIEKTNVRIIICLYFHF